MPSIKDVLDHIQASVSPGRRCGTLRVSVDANDKDKGSALDLENAHLSFQRKVPVWKRYSYHMDMQ